MTNDIAQGPHPVVATADAAVLGECPLWDDARNLLWWVDILRGRVLRGRLDGNDVQSEVAAQLNGFASFVAVGLDGGLVVGSGHDLVRLDGRCDETGRLTFDSHRPAWRFNDGAVDPSGRLLAGTLSLEGQPGTELLLRLEHDGRFTVLDSDLGLSNGLGWSPDGSLLYNVDSTRRTVFVRDYDPMGEAVGQRRVLTAMADATPDGLSVDAEGRLWIAIWNGNCVRCHDPDGTELARIPLPVPLVSSCGFAGPQLDHLIITTARAGTLDEQHAAPELAGRLFIADVSATGLPVNRWQPHDW